MKVKQRLKIKKINVKWNIVLYSYLSKEGLVRVVDSCALIVAESSPSIIITSDRAPERCSLRPAAAPPPARPRASRVHPAPRAPRPAHCICSPRGLSACMHCASIVYLSTRMGYQIERLRYDTRCR